LSSVNGRYVIENIVLPDMPHFSTGNHNEGKQVHRMGQNIFARYTSTRLF